MVSCADALDEWYAGGLRDPRTGVRGLVADKRPRRPVPVPESLGRSIPGHALRRRRVLDRATAFAVADHDDQRPPGRLRRLSAPELTAGQRVWAPRLYDLLFDPDGRPRPGEGS
jgi:hypothetical protein